MIKRIIVLLVCLMFVMTPVYAEDSATFTGSVKDGENIEITVTASSSVNVRAFVYTYSVSGAGHCLLKDVDVTDVNAGSSKTITVTPPAEGYSKKLVVTERFTLLPLCKSYTYPYMINVYAEGLGYLLLNTGTVTENGTEYSYNEFEITEFMQGEDEASALSLTFASNQN